MVLIAKEWGCALFSRLAPEVLKRLFPDCVFFDDWSICNLFAVFAIHAIVLGSLALSTPVLLYAKVAYSLCFQAIEARLASVATFTLAIAVCSAIAVGLKIALVLIFRNREDSFILDLVLVGALVVVVDFVLVVFFAIVEARS